MPRIADADDSGSAFGGLSAHGATGPGAFWQAGRFKVDLSMPRLMGIVNVTPDSFSDGSLFSSSSAAIAQCEALVKDGADILDIGGESTRPGATQVDLQTERGRVLPVLREAVKLGVPVSLDTYKAELMREALDLGVDIINDVWALRQPAAVAAVAAHPSCGVCLMHMHGEPRTMQLSPMKVDVVVGVQDFLEERTAILLGLDVAPERIAWDPGVGFGKTDAQNMALLCRQGELLGSGYPLLVGWSRKSCLGRLTGQDVDGRLVPSVAAAVLAMERGAQVLRVHDVRETFMARQIWVASRQVAATHF
jgi:dihydropteroate synthase